MSRLDVHVATGSAEWWDHIGSATRETRGKMAVKSARNILAGLFGERPESFLNQS
ncbi:hypothetical protein [Brevibacillus borstelensis]|uniref:hypothetical protein n=1 Tax=Brevibacillus borstelensis TaxID=45462 RepID=UPI0030C45F6B